MKRGDCEEKVGDVEKARIEEVDVQLKGGRERSKGPVVGRV